MNILFVIVAVLGAALLHALWNTIVKNHNDKLTMMLTIAIVQFSIALMMIPFLGLPASAAWPWLLTAAIPHTTYKIALAKAYEAGDMTKVYPISRGISIIIVTIISLFVLKENITLLGVTGIVAISGGVFALSTKDSKDVLNLTRYAIFLCIVSGISVALYTILDGIGVRIHKDTLTFINALTSYGLKFHPRGRFGSATP